MTREKAIRNKQKLIDRKYTRLLILNMLIISILMSSTLMFKVTEVSGKNKIEGENIKTVHESKEIDHEIVVSPANASTKVKEKEFSRNFTKEDKYLLAKIAMAESEGESIETKINVIHTVLNRVKSNEFPDTIEEVIFQNSNGVYQFSPVIPGGRWWTTEPNKECFKAVDIVNKTKGDTTKGALYFESCIGESWHSRNLKLLCQTDDMRFYK